MPILSRIDKIKNLAVFANYHWDPSLEQFKRYNLIYGWNGSGKTALARVFDSLGSGKHNLFPDLEYQVTIDGAQFSDKDEIATKVRVFNCDYVERNLKVLEGHVNPIYVLGEKSQEVLNQIKKDEETLNGISGDDKNPGKVELRRRAEDDRKQTERQIDSIFTSIAATISAAWGSAGAIRTYRRPNAKSTFDLLAEKEELSPPELQGCSQMLSESPEPELALLAAPTVVYQSNPLSFVDAINRISTRSKDVLETQVQNVAIDRLSALADVSKWVEQGLELHQKHSSKKCEFCQQVLPPERLSALANHFSEADKRLKTDIDELIRFIAITQAAVDSVKPYDETHLYKQLRLSYSLTASMIEAAKTKLRKLLGEATHSLSEKKNQTTEVLDYAIVLDSALLLAAIQSLNEVLKQHNETATNLEKAQDQARSKIERHHLSTILADVRDKKNKIATLEKKISELEGGNPDAVGDLGIDALRDQIASNRAKVSSAHKSCQQLNGTLRSFFGREELAFEVETNPDGQTIGFVLKRRGEIAKNVSEGERSAIGFAHFMVQLSEQEFSIKEGIVVIDDPISSLDSGVLFKVCAAIEKEMIRAGQLFVLTHNMDFFNHMKRWFLNDPRISGSDDAPEGNYRFLMIQNKYDTGTSRRIALIADLDSMLKDHESEYHYLFKKLLAFDEENPETEVMPVRAIYDYPNLARKLLECFLAYRVPTRGSMYIRLHGLRSINKEIAEEDVKFVYNFVNSHSHLNTKSGLLQFDPTLAISGRDAIKRTLALIEAADAPHYKAMSKATKK